jgi:hypothetical protein
MPTASSPRWIPLLATSAENQRIVSLMNLHQANTTTRTETVVADHKYGMAANFVTCR